MDTNFLDKSRTVMQKTLDSSRKLARAAPHRAWPGSRFISCLMPSWMSRVQRYPSGINFEQHSFLISFESILQSLSTCPTSARTKMKSKWLESRPVPVVECKLKRCTKEDRSDINEAVGLKNTYRQENNDGESETWYKNRPCLREGGGKFE